MLPAAPAFTRLRRHRTTGAAIALLLMLLGGVAGARGPVSHAEPVGCYTKQLGYDKTVFFYGYLEARDYAKYRTSDNDYCGERWAYAHVHLNPATPPGTLTAELDDCSNYPKATASTPTSGGGGSGREYYATTNHVNLLCGQALAFMDYGPFEGYGAATPYRWVD
jgi:hypothetical protein